MPKVTNAELTEWEHDCRESGSRGHAFNNDTMPLNTNVKTVMDNSCCVLIVPNFSLLESNFRGEAGKNTKWISVATLHTHTHMHDEQN